MANIFEIENTVVKFDDLELNVKQHDNYEWVISTQDIAKGYGINDSNIRVVKHRNIDELEEGKHFITVSNSNGGSDNTFWTKRGAIRLGFFIKSERAKKFRDWAEDLVISKIEQTFDIPKNYKEALLLAYNQQVKIEDQQLLIEQQAKKIDDDAEYVDLANKLLQGETEVDCQKLSAIINIKNFGRNNLMLQLKDWKILMDNNTPYRQHIEAGRCRAVSKPYTDHFGRPKVSIKTVFNYNGVAYILKMFEKKLGLKPQHVDNKD